MRCPRGRRYVERTRPVGEGVGVCLHAGPALDQPLYGRFRSTLDRPMQWRRPEGVASLVGLIVAEPIAEDVEPIQEGGSEHVDLGTRSDEALADRPMPRGRGGLQCRLGYLAHAFAANRDSPGSRPVG